MITVYLGLGSSLGDRKRNLKQAVIRLDSVSDGTRVVAASSIYESPHLGAEGEDNEYPSHLNAVLKIETSHNAHTLLARTRAIEDSLHRDRTIRRGPRTLDIDVLLYGDSAIDTADLTVPHPYMLMRAFVVIPLLELAPDVQMPDGARVADIIADGVTSLRLTRVGGPDELLL